MKARVRLSTIFPSYNTDGSSAHTAGVREANEVWFTAHR